MAINITNPITFERHETGWERESRLDLKWNCVVRLRCGDILYEGRGKIHSHYSWALSPILKYNSNIWYFNLWQIFTRYEKDFRVSCGFSKNYRCLARRKPKQYKIYESHRIVRALLFTIITHSTTSCSLSLIIIRSTIFLKKVLKLNWH